MSTHCGIAIKSEKGYEVVYCHHDGAPSYMLPMLTENYNSEELAIKLVGLGDASSISPRIAPALNESHSFDRPVRDVSVFYHRDRGEPWEDTQPAIFNKEERLEQFWFAYIWENGQWNAYEDGEVVVR